MSIKLLLIVCSFIVGSIFFSSMSAFAGVTGEPKEEVIKNKKTPTLNKQDEVQVPGYDGQMNSAEVETKNEIDLDKIRSDSHAEKISNTPGG